MSLISSRIMYVTEAERAVLKHLSSMQLSDLFFIKEVSMLLGVNEDLIVRHNWKIIVVDKVKKRCGRNWQTRDTLRDKMDRNNKEKVKTARQKAIESLKVQDG